MLTNLEEYNRVKCAQYWPGAGDSNYVVSPHCLINVGFCTEKRYSDYIVRDLTMTVRTQKAGEDKATTGPVTNTILCFCKYRIKDMDVSLTFCLCPHGTMIFPGPLRPNQWAYFKPHGVI